MAQVPTIPVQTGEYDPEGRKIFNLPYETRVIVATGLPAFSDIGVKPQSGSIRKFSPEGRMAKHYEIRYRPDLQLHWVRPKTIHPLAGKVVRTVSPQKLHGLEAHTPILFLVDGVWHHGWIQPYEDRIKLRKEAEQAKKKAKAKHRRWLRLPTIWDRLSADD